MGRSVSSEKSEELESSRWIVDGFKDPSG